MDSGGIMLCQCGCNQDIKRFIDIVKENNIKTLEEALNCKELWNLDNGIVYCKNCHIKLNYKGGLL